MLTRLARIQLGVFALITTLSVGVTAIFYVDLPAQLGHGTYTVTANFASSGGLYKNANVTYRGTTIGKVTDVGLKRGGGVYATMRLDREPPVPMEVVASVKSMSAIGEQFVDLVPTGNASGHLHDGAVIDRAHTAISQDVAGMLKQAQALVDSLEQSRLREVLQSTFTAFNGTGDELARLIQSARLLVDAAKEHSDETVALIEQGGEFLDGQIRSSADIARWARNLHALTGNVRQANPQLRQVLQSAPAAIAAAQMTVDGIRVSFPMLAASLAGFGRIGVIYQHSIEQILVLVPALTAMLISVASGQPPDEGAKTDFKFNLGAPPPCSVGFLPPTQIRSPADETIVELPPDLYCKVPQNDATVVRGARNYPCQEFPGKRAPTVALCRDPQGYVPLGSNPWRGPPIPAGTPVTDPRNILPPNNYPYVPPEADPDPGPPVVELPPGVPAGPGPALNPPYPLPVPPNTPGPQPPPLPYTAPPNETLPPYNQPRSVPLTPAAPPGTDGPSMAGMSDVTHYDATTGAFQDSSGNLGVYASGAAGMRPQETWVDLMLDPRLH